MMQAHFYANPDGCIGVTHLHDDSIKTNTYGRHFLCTKEISEKEWNDILNFPHPDSETISNFLQNTFLQSFIQRNVSDILSRIRSKGMGGNQEMVTY